MANIKPEVLALKGSELYKSRVTNFTDQQLKNAWIAQIESYQNQNDTLDSETDQRDWTALMGLEGDLRGIDFSRLESPSED